jgi:predicted transcriptional regulator
MGAIKVNLPADLEHRLDREAELVGRPRSDVIREALALFIACRERERLKGEHVHQAGQGSGIERSEGVLTHYNEDPAEGRQPGDHCLDESGGSWWKWPDGARFGSPT